MDKYFSFAKIILMGEYAVLHGADAICLPLKTGQQLQISETNERLIHWKWVYKDQVLAQFRFDLLTLDVIESSQSEPNWAKKLLQIIRKYNPYFLKDKGVSLHFTNYFPPQWGLGASSASISSLCRYAGVNPYWVNKELMGGSGADIACTTASSWFLYRNVLPIPPVWELPFAFPHRGNMFFIYSGNKQATASHLSSI
jgi:mevalonate kinase